MSDETYNIEVTDTGTDQTTARFNRLADAQERVERDTGALSSAFAGIASAATGITSALSGVAGISESLSGTVQGLNSGLGGIAFIFGEQGAAAGRAAAGYGTLTAALRGADVALEGMAASAGKESGALDALNGSVASALAGQTELTAQWGNAYIAATEVTAATEALGVATEAAGSGINIVDTSIKACTDEVNRLRPALGDINKAFGSWGDDLSTVQLRTRDQTTTLQAHTTAVEADTVSVKEQQAIYEKWLTTFDHTAGSMKSATASTQQLVPATVSLGAATNEVASSHERASAAANTHVQGMQNLYSSFMRVQQAMFGLIAIRIVEYFTAATEATSAWQDALAATLNKTDQVGAAIDNIGKLSRQTGASQASLAATTSAVSDALQQTSGHLTSINGAAAVYDMTLQGVNGSTSTFALAMQAARPSATAMEASLAAMRNAADTGSVSLANLKTMAATSAVGLGAIAAASGKTTQQLADMASAGTLTFAKFNAMVGAANALVSGLKQPPPSVSGAWVALTSAVQTYVGGAASAQGITGGIAQTMILLADNLDTVVPIAIKFAGVISGIIALQMVVWITRLTAALLVQGSVLLANTALWVAENAILVLVALAIAGVVAAFIYFADNMAELTKGIPVLGALFADIKVKADVLKGGWSQLVDTGEKVVGKFKDMFTQTGLTKSQQDAYNTSIGAYNGLAGTATASSNGLASATKSAGDAAGVAGLGFSNLNGQLTITASNMGNVMSRTLVADQIFAKYGSSTNAAYDALAQFDREAGNAGYVINAFGEYVKVANDNSSAFVGTLNNVAAAAGAVSLAMDGATFSTKSFQDSTQGPGQSGGSYTSNVSFDYQDPNYGVSSDVWAWLQKTNYGRTAGITGGLAPPTVDPWDVGTTRRHIGDWAKEATAAYNNISALTNTATLAGTPTNLTPIPTANMALNTVPSTSATVAKQSTASASGPVNVQMTVITQDANSFQRSAKQVAAGAKQAFALAVA